MRVLTMKAHEDCYSSNVYLVLGDWNKLGDTNALVDVGRDPRLLDWLRRASTGVGKKKVDAVVLTHSHYDHAALLSRVCDEFHPKVFAHASAVPEVTRVLRDGDRIPLGDQEFEVIAIHGHTADSICLHHGPTGTLFAGDAPLLIQSGGGHYEADFVSALERLCRLNIQLIYPGHGPAVFEDCNARLRASLALIQSEWARQRN